MSKTTGASAPAKRAPATKKPRTTIVAISPEPEEAAKGPLSKHWRTYFLAALAETSHVALSARRVGTSLSRVYKVRREDAKFRARWAAALNEGYEHLELEVLAYLRSPEPDSRIDVPAALRLLAAHRDTVARQRALGDDMDEAAVLDSIDSFIDEMRERSAANDKVIAETACGGEETSFEEAGDEDADR